MGVEQPSVGWPTPREHKEEKTCQQYGCSDEALSRKGLASFCSDRCPGVISNPLSRKKKRKRESPTEGLH